MMTKGGGWRGVDSGAIRRRFSWNVLFHFFSFELQYLAMNTSANMSNLDWCSLDSGVVYLTNQFGTRQLVHISLTRDGSVWVRVGSDQSASEWTVDEETRFPLQLSVLDPSEVNLLTFINYTDSCALTDVVMLVRADSGWHPSYLTVFDPTDKETKVVLFRHNKDCHMSTNLSLSDDRQGLFCEGGLKSACGQRNLPEAGTDSPTVFLRTINFDPNGPERWQCAEDPSKNSYTFKGSYYHVYAKMATCDKPRDSRSFGHETKMRPNKDESLRSAVLIPDPMHGSLHDGLIVGWRLFVKILSVRHEIFLQVWRRTPSTAAPAASPAPAPAPAPAAAEETYTLVGETFVRPSELRYTELSLEPRQFLEVKRGDVLGMHFPDLNPIGWSSVPCAFDGQRYRVSALSNNSSSSARVQVGSSLKFDPAPPGDDACRQYSFLAVYGNQSESKLIEDWICPSANPTFTRKRTKFHTHQRNGQSSALDALDGRGGPKGGGGGGSGGGEGGGAWDHRPGPTTSATGLPVHVLMAVVASLLLLMSLTGLVSYCKAVKH